MTRILVISRGIPWPLANGYALRIYQLAKHLQPSDACHLACLEADASKLTELERNEVFESITLLPELPARKHWRRLLRRDGNRDYHRLAYPDHFRTAVGMLQDVVDRHHIDIVVSYGVLCEEFMRPLRGARKLLDQCDCGTLTIERDLAVRQGLSRRERHRWLQRLREVMATESKLVDRCDHVTAISPPDVARLQELNPDGPEITVLPNGVDARFLAPWPRTAVPRRAVAFWGNLRFSVNRLAVEYFYEEIWRPHLLPAGVRWAIIGPSEGTWLRDLAARHPEIETPGFVQDLLAHLAPYPIMVNPMRNGAGLKNKVLEAMAAGKAIVTTSLGVDALPFVDGRHGLVADDPAAFAAAVIGLLDDPERRDRLADAARSLVEERYTWGAVGAEWSALLAKVGGVQSR